MKKQISIMVLAAAVLIACGGGDEDTFKEPGDPGTPPPGAGDPVPASLTLQTSLPQIPSNGSAPAEITAFVRGANNQYMEGVAVTFQADSGGLAITQGTTDVNGVAKATLTPAADPTDRAITVTATAGTVSANISVAVSGTTLSISGPDSLVMNDQGEYTIILTDAGGQGISNRAITVASQSSNPLSATSVTTDATGRATVTMTASNSGSDTITASALGETDTLPVSVSNDSFAITAPAPNTEIALGQTATVTVTWTAGGVPQVGQPIDFSSTRGTLSATQVTTNGSGQASVTISSTNAGAAFVRATATGASTQLPLEFVATVPSTIEVQPSPTTIGTGEQSTVTAVVRDAQGNLVKNRTVNFQLQDVTGGTLNVGSAITDSQGRAQTVYTASSTTSATNGVVITGTVQGASGVTDTAAITVAQRAVFLSLGTGNEIVEPNIAEYELTYAVRATDAAGNGVNGINVNMSIKSRYYVAGRRLKDAISGEWVFEENDLCYDEDLNEDGILNAGEDVNTSTRLEAGNVTAVSPGSITTADGGLALVKVRYPQDHADWVIVELIAKTTVQGTETTRSTFFRLPMSAPDANSDAPPGPISPFGVTDVNCTHVIP